ncbi:cadherin-like domain-containing protein, partial [Xanthobacter tagetidis]
DVTRASVGLTVAQPNRAPVATDDARTTAEDTPLVVSAADLLANDGDLDGDTLSIIGFGGASGGTLVYSGGTFTFTPDADYSGPASFTYTVSDGKGGTDTATVNVTVTPVNDAPVAADDERITLEDRPLVIPVSDLLANDGDVDGDTLSVTGVGGAVGGTVSLDNGAITFTPDADFNGDASFTYTVSDGKGGTDTATVAVTVTPVNDAPVAVGDTATTAEDTPLVIAAADLLANDADTDGDMLSVTGVSGAVGGTVALDDGEITFTPDADFNGPASFTYNVSDGNGRTDTATVNITVTPVNDTPSDLALSSSQIAENLAGATIGTLSASDPDSGDTLTYSIQPGGDGALFTISGNELRVGEAGLDYEVSATRSVTVRATDSKGAYTEETFTIDVLDRPETVLTTGADVFEGTAADEQVFVPYFFANYTLNPQDRLSGGDGYDVLILDGSGQFNLSTLAEFTGFEEVRLVNNPFGTPASVFLRDGVDIKVNAIDRTNFYLSTGLETITAGSMGGYFYVDRPVELSAGDVLHGGGGQDFLYLSGGDTIDLSASEIRWIETLSIQGPTTAIVDDAVLVDFTAVEGSGNGAKVVTGASSLDLSGKALAAVSVLSTNASGTTFTITSPAAGYSILGGPGNDTLVANGFAYTAEQRAVILAATGIDNIQDSSGTYMQPARPVGSSSLTTASDVVTASADDQTVYGTSGTLNPGDSLAGGGGTDALVLLGDGVFDLASLAAFSGFEEVRLVNDFNTAGASLKLRDGVDLSVTGSASDDVFILSTGADKIDGGTGFDTFRIESTADLTTADQLRGGDDLDYLLLSSDETYDLTDIDFEGIEILSLRNYATAVVNNDVLAKLSLVTVDYSGIFGGTLSTADSTLDLSGKVGNVPYIVSTNATGTTFTVDTAETARFVKGGAGIDTLVVSGLSLTNSQRQSVFDNGSVEIIRDATGIYGDETANTLVGTTASEIISGGGGADVLTGGAGGDTFVLSTEAGARISDFNAVGGLVADDDSLDIGALISASSFVAGDDLADFVWVEDADGDAGTSSAYVMYDADGAGAGAAVQHTQLDGLNAGDTLHLAYNGTTTDLMVIL